MDSLESQANAKAASVTAEEPALRSVLPSLVSAYCERGYDAGYARGVNDMLAQVLLAADRFARLRPESATDTRRLLYAFSEFLEDQVPRTPAYPDHFVAEGLGI